MEVGCYLVWWLLVYGGRTAGRLDGRRGESALLRSTAVLLNTVYKAGTQHQHSACTARSVNVLLYVIIFFKLICQLTS